MPVFLFLSGSLKRREGHDSGSFHAKKSEPVKVRLTYKSKNVLLQTDLSEYFQISISKR